jgi:hypothetical protein
MCGLNDTRDKITDLSTFYLDAICVEYRFSDPGTLFYNFPVFLLFEDLQSGILQFKEFA